MKKLMYALVFLFSIGNLTAQDHVSVAINYVPSDCFAAEPSESIVTLLAPDATTVLDQVVVLYDATGAVSSQTQMGSTIIWDGVLVDNNFHDVELTNLADTTYFLTSQVTNLCASGEYITGALYGYAVNRVGEIDFNNLTTEQCDAIRNCVIGSLTAENFEDIVDGLISADDPNSIIQGSDGLLLSNSSTMTIQNDMTIGGTTYNAGTSLEDILQALVAQALLDHMNVDQVNNTGVERVHRLNGQNYKFIVEPGVQFGFYNTTGSAIIEGEGGTY